MRPASIRPVAVVSCAALLATAAAVGSVRAAGGKWTPEQLLAHDPAWLRELGLVIPPSELWDPDRGGLLEAVVRINGCSAGFVSPEGLIVTNHHCAFSLLQEHSTPERDLIADGFLAPDRRGELHGSVLRATVPHRFTDVTERVENAAAGAQGGLARYEALDRVKKELVGECEKRPGRRCRVATYDDGVRYVLVEALEFRDVRLAWAPPRAVGEYGGEEDNWMWPRHTGDFALLRVYADADNGPTTHDPSNVPYRPRRYLPVAQDGVRKDSFVMVAGYPGRTYRRLIAPEVEERYRLYYPRRAALYRDWMDIIEDAETADARIALAGRLKSLANAEKNARGQVMAIRRGHLLEKKRELDDAVLLHAAEGADPETTFRAFKALGRLVAERQPAWDRDFLLDQLQRGPLPVSHALGITRWAMEWQKPDAERDPEYQERNRTYAERALRRDQSRLHLPTEVRLLADWLGRAAALPPDLRVDAVETRLGEGERDAAAMERLARSLLDGTRLLRLPDRMALFHQDERQLRKHHDPLLDFAFDLWEEMLVVERLDKGREGAISLYRPVWRRAVEATVGRPLDPDANGTLRVSLAHVRGYSPRDAVWMTPLTRLAGLVEKHTGVEPFDAPDTLLRNAPDGARSRWAEPSIGDVPVCFLATGDTTGGSSGSPVLNGRGELVGVNFDRVWENVANDFGYDPDVARNISADVRYMLWILDESSAAAAAALLRELGVDERRASGARDGGSD